LAYQKKGEGIKVPSKVRLSVIILNWNGKSLSERCLTSLASQTLPPFETILVDNGSADGSVPYLKRKFPEITFLPLPHNVGFSEAYNKAFDSAKGNFFLALNNDTILPPDAIRRICDGIAPSRVHGMYALRMVLPDGSVDNLGLVVDRYGLSWENKDPSLPIDGPCGGAGIYSRDMLMDIKDAHGFFDSRFFLYFEDVELIMRAKKKGYTCGLLDDIKVTHAHGATSKKIRSAALYFFNRNRVIAHKKHIRGFWNHSVFFLMQCVVVVRRLRKAGVVIQAIKDGYACRIHPPSWVLKRFRD